MDWLSHPWPLHRADPTAVRRYLDSVRPPSHYPRPQYTFYSEDFYSMTHQSKKKRIEDDSLPADAGSKPVQLQRRRVWRACESCRFVPHPARPSPSPLSNTFPDTIVDRRKKIKCDGCEPTCAQCQSSGSHCTWLQTKDRAALSRQYVVTPPRAHLTLTFPQLCPRTRSASTPYGIPLFSNNACPRAAWAILGCSIHSRPVLRNRDRWGRQFTFGINSSPGNVIQGRRRYPHGGQLLTRVLFRQDGRRCLRVFWSARLG